MNSLKLYWTLDRVTKYGLHHKGKLKKPRRRSSYEVYHIPRVYTAIIFNFTLRMNRNSKISKPPSKEKKKEIKFFIVIKVYTVTFFIEWTKI